MEKRHRNDGLNNDSIFRFVWITFESERIKKENLFERIVIVDNFYPKIDGEHNYPEIFFKNNKFKSFRGFCPYKF